MTACKGTLHNPIYLGCEPVVVSDIEVAMGEAHEDAFDFLVCNLAHPLHKRQLLAQLSEYQPPFTRSDLLLDSSSWSAFVVGKISSVMADSNCLQTRKHADATISEEVAWAAHLSLPAILFPTPFPSYHNYAKILRRSTLEYRGQIWVRIPMTLSSEADIGQTWEWWNQIRILSEHQPRVLVALEMSADLPDEKFIDRWFGEPVQALIIPTNIFLPNAKGFPTLSAAHQKCFRKFYRLKLQYILSGKTEYPNRYAYYRQYLQHLVDHTPPLTPQQEFESPFYDYLQAPLQPLKDNLQSQTYEVFERDPIKYARYQEAIRQALVDRAGQSIVLMVVGAGRGPLVTAALQAAEEANHEDLRIYAVEKNPNAVVTLRNKQIYYGWGEKVTIVSTDMRVWNAPELADILVSELLGSFGDNELSPECLDGAQRFLKEDGISIPESYTSFISPLSTPKLWSEVQQYQDVEHFETAYVVRVHNAYVIAPPQEVFHFVHPNRSETIDNSRFIELEFTANANSLMHGFVGYFSSQLYKEVNISIHPDTFSEGMFSWFPIYFPIRVPMYVKEGETIRISIWRVCTSSKVWYEWCVSSPSVTNIHNPSGRSYWIGL